MTEENGLDREYEVITKIYDLDYIQGIYKGTDHVMCPALCICGDDVYFVNLEEGVWIIVCDKCGIVFGLPYGYSSRLDMVEDWNKLLIQGECS